MVNSSCVTEPHSDEFKDNQPECEAVQSKESAKEVSINAAEQEAGLGPVTIFSHVTQDNGVKDILPYTELVLESADPNEIYTALEDLTEVKQAHVMTNETEEHSTDIKNESHGQPDLDGPVIKLLRDLDEVENRNNTTSSPEPQTPHEDQSSPNPFHEHSVDVNGDSILLQEIEETRMDPKARDDRPERMSDSALDYLEETCFNSEIQLQATEDAETLEPPTKKKIRKRMGMCGLGDRKRKFPFDGQHSRQGLTGKQMEEEAGKANEVVQHLYTTVLGNEATTPMDCKGTTRPAFKENEEVLKDSKKKGSAVIYDERTTDEFSTEHRDEQSMWVENNGTIMKVDDKGAAEEIGLEHELNLLEDILTEVGQTVLRVTIGKNLTMIRDKPSILDATNDHEMDIAICDDEPNFPGSEMTNNAKDIKFNMKLDVLAEKRILYADNKVEDDGGEIVAEVKAAQEVSSTSVHATAEMPEGPVMDVKEVQEVSGGLKESKMEIEEQCRPSMAASWELDLAGPELSGSTENNIDLSELYGENNEPVTEPAGGEAKSTKGISEPIVPLTGQEKHMHVSGVVTGALSRT